MKQNKYKIESNIKKILSDNNTNFININDYNNLKYKLKNINYNIYYPYKNAEKILLYTNKLPEITLFKISSPNHLEHREILGTLFSLNIDNSYIGDIIIDNSNYYFYTLTTMKEYIKTNLITISNKPISLIELNFNELESYEKKYLEKELLTSSIRIDTVVSRIIGTSRKTISEMIKNKELVVNYKVLTKDSYFLKENDIFSIKKYGKYKFIGITKTTKKDNYIIKYLKYL